MLPLIFAAISGFTVNAGDEVRFVEYPGDGGAKAEYIPGGTGPDERVTRLVWPDSANAMAGTIDGVYRRALVASLFGLPNWFVTFGRGFYQMNLGLLKNVGALEEMLPPCESAWCIYNHTNRVYSYEGKRITARYINNLNHFLFQTCDGRGEKAWQTDKQTMGFGRVDPYTFAGIDLQLGGHGNGGVIAWTAADLPGIELHGRDSRWTPNLFGMDGNCLGTMFAGSEGFWTRFLVPFSEVLHDERAESVLNAFVNNRVSDFVYLGKRGTSDYEGYMARFTGARKTYWFGAQLKRVTEGAAREIVEKTKRIDYGEWAHGNGLERLCDTVVCGPDAMPKPAYGSSREAGEKLVQQSYFGTNFLYWSESLGKFAARGVTPLDLKSETETNRVWSVITNQASKIFVTALYCGSDVPNTTYSLTGGAVGRVYLTYEDLQHMAAEAVRSYPGEGWMFIEYFDYQAPPYFTGAPRIRVAYSKGGGIMSFYKNLDNDPIAVDVNVGATFKFDMARVTSQRRALNSTGYDWPERQSVGFFPHQVLSPTYWTDVDAVQQTAFNWTYLLAANAASAAKSASVAGEDAVVTPSQFNFRLNGGDAGTDYFGGVYPGFALEQYGEVETKAREAVNAIAGVNVEAVPLLTIVAGVTGQAAKNHMAAMAVAVASNMTATANMTEARIFRIWTNADGSVDASRIDSKTGAADWQRESLPIEIRFTLDVDSPDPGEDRMPSAYINYRSATGLGACFGVGASTWLFKRIDL